MDILDLIRLLLPSLVVGIIMALYNRKQSKRDKERDKIEDARRDESLLALELQMATAKLSYATAMALKRGQANGEVEEGIAAYEEAKTKYYAFLNRQAMEHIRK